MINDGILKVKTDDIKYYLQCPMRFKLNNWSKCEDKPKPKELEMEDYISSALVECVKSILMRHAFDGEAPSLGSVIKLWNKAWKYIYGRYGKNPEIVDRYLHHTLRLQQYYNKHVFRTNHYRLVPLLYDYNYVVNYDNVDLMGHIDFGFYNKHRYSDDVELGFLSDTLPKHLGNYVKTDYNILTSIYKFREDFDVKCNNVLYFNPASLKWVRVEIPYTNKQIYDIIFDICKSLSNRIGFRNPGLYCKSCKYHDKLMCAF